jgi:hypothetical protein
MMRDGRGYEMGGGGVGGDNYYNTRIRTPIDYGRRRRPAATMGCHSRLLITHQSASILCGRTLSLKLEITIIIDVY